MHCDCQTKWYWRHHPAACQGTSSICEHLFVQAGIFGNNIGGWILSSPKDSTQSSSSSRWISVRHGIVVCMVLSAVVLSCEVLSYMNHRRVWILQQQQLLPEDEFVPLLVISPCLSVDIEVYEEWYFVFSNIEKKTVVYKPKLLYTIRWTAYGTILNTICWIS